MALSSSIVWETRASGASDNNGGGFKAGATGTDRSQQNSAQVVIDNSTITTSITTNVITFTGGYTATSADVGNVVQMLTGTNVTAGWYEITAQTSTTWTVDRNVVTSGTTTNSTGNMGGALATISKLSGAMVASNKAYVTGAFTSTATNTFAQTVAPTAANSPTRLIGYSSARGDSGHATLTLQTNTGLTGISATGSGFWMEQVDVDCGSLGTSTGVNLAGASSQCRNCKISNFTTRGLLIGSSATEATDLELTGGGSAATAAIDNSANGIVSGCFIHDNQCLGLLLMLNGRAIRNLIVNNSGASSDGIQIQSAGNLEIWNNVIHNNGRDGIRYTNSSQVHMVIKNNIITSNGGWGINFSGGSFPAHPNYDGNAFLSNTSGNRNGMDSTTGIYGVVPYTNVRDVILSVSPYVGGTTGTTANFALNNTAGGGAACKAVATPTVWPGNSG